MLGRLGDGDGGGPWTFHGNNVLMAPYDGLTKRSTIELKHLKMWIQIHDLPDRYNHLIPTLVGKVNKFTAEEGSSFNSSGIFFGRLVSGMWDAQSSLQGT